MGIERASVLYPVNSTTVDSAAGIDIRLLDDVQAGATDSDQSVRFVHDSEGIRTFDPDNALVTTEADPAVFQGEGWALRLTEDMTPADDTNCNAMLTSGTLTVNVRVLLNMNGGTNTGGDTEASFIASLWRYNTSSNTGVSIASGSQTEIWDTTALGAENNTRKNIAISVTVASNTEFLTNEVLLLQIGVDAIFLPNPALGTTNFDYTLDVDDANTNITFAANQGIKQWCRLSGDPIGNGTVTRSLAITQPRSATGNGTVTSTKATIASKSFDLVGKGTVTHTKAIAEDFDLVGKGTPTMSRVVAASHTATLTGKGTVTHGAMDIGMVETATGKGTVTSTKATIAAKSFDLVGKGVVTEVHPVQAFRSFALVGKGEILMSGANGSTITLPLDELPTGEGGGNTYSRGRVVNT